MARKSSNKVRALHYKHSVEVVARGGRFRATVSATDQIAVWSNRRQNGPTVRADGVTHRFPDAQVVKSSVTF